MSNIGFFKNNSGFDNQLSKKNDDDAGLDLCADLLSTIIISKNIDEYGEKQYEEMYIEYTEDDILDVIIPARGKAVINTSTRVKIPDNHVGLVWSRSGLSVKHSLEVGAGCIDCGYTGDVKVVLYNHSDMDYVLKHGDRVAQLLTIPVNLNRYVQVDALTETDRGDKGFGSTGK